MHTTSDTIQVHQGVAEGSYHIHFSLYRRIDGPGPMVGAADREETEQTFENAFETLKLVDASIFS